MKLFAISLMFVACFCILIGLIQNVVNTDHAGIYPADRNVIHLNGDDVNLWWFVQVHKNLILVMLVIQKEIGMRV